MADRWEIREKPENPHKAPRFVVWDLLADRTAVVRAYWTQGMAQAWIDRVDPANYCTGCARPVALPPQNCPTPGKHRHGGRTVVDEALDPELTARQNAERRTLWTRQQVLEMLSLQRRDDAAALRAFIGEYGGWPEMQLEWNAAANYLFTPEEEGIDEDQ